MIKKINLCLLSLALSSIVCSQQLLAETVPNAGSLRQEIEKKDELPEPQKEPVLSIPTPKSESTAKGASVTVKTFYFSGNTVLSKQALDEAVASLLNRPLTFTELETVTAIVAETYRKAGWIARAYFPPQDVNEGAVSVKIVESIFGETQVSGDTLRRVTSKRLVAMVAAKQTRGQLMNADAMDNVLRRMNELPGVGVAGVLSAGQQVRETNLVLDVTEGSVVSGDIAADNAGSEFSGENRITSTIYLNSPFAYSEQIRTTLLHSKGTDYAQLAATIPVTTGGLRVGAHASTLDYTLLGEATLLDASGSSKSFGLDASYPLIRSRYQNLSFLTTYDDASFSNETGGVLESKYKVSALDLTLSGYTFDKLGGGGINQAALTFVSGKVTLDDSANRVSDKDSSTAGSFNKVRYSINRQQTLTKSLSLYGSLAGQFAGKNLTSSEKFTLGGASGVRAYQSTEGSGDVGQLLNVELRMNVPFSIRVAAFYDMGHITTDKEPTSVSDHLPNSYSLKGAGLSVDWSSKSGFNLKATWATRIGSNPTVVSDVSTTPAANSDKTSDKNRIWLQAIASF